MPSPEQVVKTLLAEMGMPEENLEQAARKIIEVRARLAESMAKFQKQGLMRSLALSQDMKAIQVVEELTDCIVQNQGVLEQALKGKDIYDELAIIKAKIYSMITEQQEEPLTLEKLKSTTQRLAKMKRQILQEDEDD